MTTDPNLNISVTSDSAVAGVNAFDAAIGRVVASLRTAVPGFTGLENAFTQLAGSLQRSIAIYGAVAAAIYGVWHSIREIVTIAAEGERTQRRLEFALRSLDNAAGITAESVGELTERLRGITNFDDDALTEATTSLLRFGRVTSDTLEEALTTAGNLAAVMRTEVPEAARLLSRALAEPGEGLELFKRAGLRLTQGEIFDVQRAAYSQGDDAARRQTLEVLNRRGLTGAAQDEAQGLYGGIRAAGRAFDDFLKSLGRFTPFWAVVVGGLNLFSYALDGVSGIVNRLSAEIRSFYEWVRARLPSITRSGNLDTPAQQGLDAARVEEMRQRIDEYRTLIEDFQRQLTDLPQNGFERVGRQNYLESQIAQYRAEIRGMEDEIAGFQQRQEESARRARESGEAAITQRFEAVARGLGYELTASGDVVHKEADRAIADMNTLAQAFERGTISGRTFADMWQQLATKIGAALPALTQAQNSINRQLEDQALNPDQLRARNTQRQLLSSIIGETAANAPWSQTTQALNILRSQLSQQGGGISPEAQARNQETLETINRILAGGAQLSAGQRSADRRNSQYEAGIEFWRTAPIQLRQLRDLAAAWGENRDAVRQTELANRLLDEQQRLGTGNRDRLLQQLTVERDLRDAIAVRTALMESAERTADSLASRRAILAGPAAEAAEAAAQRAREFGRKQGLASDDPALAVLQRRFAIEDAARREEGSARQTRAYRDQIELTNAEASALIASDSARRRIIDTLKFEQRVRNELVGVSEEQIALERQAFIASQDALDNLDRMRNLADGLTQAGDRIASAFEDAIFSGKSLRDILASLTQDLARLFLRTAILNPLGDLFKNLVGRAFGSAEGNLIGPSGRMPVQAYAGGGMAYGPQLSIFGEGSTPELYLPAPGGQVPIRWLGQRPSGGGVTMVNNITVGNASGDPVQNAEQARMIAAQISLLSKGIDARIDSRILHQQRAGGTLGPRL